MKTNGLLSSEQVEGADGNPHNLRQDTTSAVSLLFSGAAPEIVVAEQLFTCQRAARPTVMVPLMINRKVPFGFTLDSKGLLLNLDARNGSNERILLIRESELVLSRSAWDATLVGNKLSIWNEPREVSLELILKPPNRIVIQRYKIAIDGVDVDIAPERIEIRGAAIPRVQLSGKGVISANVGMLIGDHPKGLSVGIKIA